MFFICIPAVFSLAMIGYEDLHYRAIHWFWLPVCAVLVVLMRYETFPDINMWMDCLYNMMFILLQVSLLLGYFAFKGIGLKGLLQKYMGLGDLLFFPVAALAFPFPEFLIFFNGSLILALLSGLTIFRNKNIPLAGIQALLLAVFILTEVTGLKLYN